MAKPRHKLNARIRKRLIEDAGYKCANPGCPNARTHFHHINQWHIYETDDEQSMIAVCPACHDAIHHGQIKLTDSTVYSWKQIIREPHIARQHLYIEPAANPELWFGSFAICVDHPSAVIKLSSANEVELRVVDSEILLVEAVLTTVEGVEVLRIRHNYVTHEKRSDISFKTVPGQVMITAPRTSGLVPDWLIDRMRRVEPDFPSNNELVLFHATVVRPGIARIHGIWAQDDRAIVSNRGLHFVSPTHEGPVTLFAQVEGETKMKFSGPIDRKIFGFADDNAIWGLKSFDPRNGPLAKRTT